jgi:hypothetical protein
LSKAKIKQSIENKALMIKFLFLVPFSMCLIWWLYLKEKGYTLKQGLKGFAYILGFNLVIAAFFTVMIFVTH